MLLVVPISNADKKLIPFFLQGMQQFHPGIGHKLLVIGFNNVATEVENVASFLTVSFNDTQTLIVDHPGELGWPIATNQLFFAAATKISQTYQPHEQWLWMELDSCPLRKDWLSSIAREYENYQKPYMGVEVITRESRGGFLVPESETGTHMAAVSVYPQDIATRINILHVCTTIQKPFYEYLQWYIVPGMHKTNLIQHNWMTSEYQKQGDEIICKSVNRFAYGIHYNAPVSREAVLLHGVKDGTLHTLLGGNKTQEQANISKEEEPPRIIPPRPPENYVAAPATVAPAEPAPQPLRSFKVIPHNQLPKDIQILTGKEAEGKEIIFVQAPKKKQRRHGKRRFKTGRPPKIRRTITEEDRKARRERMLEYLKKGRESKARKKEEARLLAQAEEIAKQHE